MEPRGGRRPRKTSAANGAGEFALKSKPASILRVLGRLVSGQRRRLVLVAVVSFLGGVSEALVLAIIAKLAFAIAANDDSIRVTISSIDIHVTAAGLVGVAVALVIVRVAMQAIAIWESTKVATQAISTGRIDAVRLYLGASWELQADERRGQLQEMTTTQVGQTSAVLNAAVAFIVNTVTLVALLTAALFANVWATLAATFIVVLLALFLRPLRNRIRRRSALTATANAEFAASISELSEISREIRVFGVDREAQEDIGAAIDEHQRSYFKTQILAGMLPAAYQGVALLLILGTLALVQSMDLADVSALGAVVLIMLRSLSYGQAAQSSYQGVIVGVPYVEQFLEHQDRYRAAAIDASGSALTRFDSLEFRKVTFAYSAEPVLHDVSFRIEAGTMLGIIGPSGAGKSTLVQLLLRLREPGSGEIRANDRSIRDFSLASWYEEIAFVPQEARLIPGTVADNIRFYRSASEDDVKRAAKLAHIHDDIETWPNGYETSVGERATQLSGGQSQRLCIARALLRDPSIVILDEPTSALDVHSELLIRTTLADLTPAKTIVVIAHRLSTLSACGQILVLRNGVVEAFGAPDALERSSDFYAETLRVAGLR
jgi:ABC-type multidrug transport system fused ATPase/permease subunit